MREGVIATAGMCLFALFAQRPLPLFGASLAGLLVVAALIVRAVGRESSVLSVFGWVPFSRRVGFVTMASCALGVMLGLGYRSAYDLSLVPGSLQLFVVSAALIGATEELVFRGYIQGRLTGTGFWVAPVFAAASHTAYKSALFVFPPHGVEINLAVLASLTFVAGLAFALMRQLSGCVLPAVAAHMLFDILAYGDRAQAPWWVWR